jgi:hypothetical protein
MQLEAGYVMAMQCGYSRLQTPSCSSLSNIESKILLNNVLRNNFHGDSNFSAGYLMSP